MAVYVDAVFFWPIDGLAGQARRVAERNGGRWAHMWCDSGSEEELHRIAAAIGLKREWFQDKTVFPHYDLTPGRQRAALRRGVIEKDLRKWMRERRNKHETGGAA